MKTDKLAAMANQIASYFAAYPDDRAIAGVADHIRKFWTPRMHGLLRDQAQRGDPTLDRLVVAAMQFSARAESPATNEAGGDLAQCDAG